MNSVTIHAKSIKKFIKLLENNLLEGVLPTVAFIYASPKFNMEKLVKKLAKYEFLIIGGTTAGEVYANEEEGSCEVEGEIVAMLMDIKKEALALTVIEIEDEDSYVIGEHIGKWAKSYFSNVSIITLTSGLSFDNDAYTQGIVSKGIEYVFGGATGDDLLLENTFITQTAS